MSATWLVVLVLMILSISGPAWAGGLLTVVGCTISSGPDVGDFRELPSKSLSQMRR